MGVSFIQYLNDYRLEIAAELLTTTTDTILDIAIATGFNNISYFNRCFKKNMAFRQEVSMLKTDEKRNNTISHLLCSRCV